MTQSANDNLYVMDWDKNKLPMPDGWQNYDKVSMTPFGPIGINSDGFVYLDPDKQAGTPAPTILYSVVERDNHGACICDGYDRKKVIDEATAYFEIQRMDADEYGEAEEEVSLVILDEEADTETVEDLTLDTSTERNTYDGGSFDYLAGIGAI